MNECSLTNSKNSTSIHSWMVGWVWSVSLSFILKIEIYNLFFLAYERVLSVLAQLKYFFLTEMEGGRKGSRKQESSTDRAKKSFSLSYPLTCLLTYPPPLPLPPPLSPLHTTTAQTRVVRVKTHAYIYIYIYIHTYTHIHSHIHTYTRTHLEIMWLEVLANLAANNSSGNNSTSTTTTTTAPVTTNAPDNNNSTTTTPEPFTTTRSIPNGTNGNFSLRAIAQAFHDVPHYDFSFKPVSNTFAPTEAPYQVSMVGATVVLYEFFKRIVPHTRAVCPSVIDERRGEERRGEERRGEERRGFI